MTAPGTDLAESPPSIEQLNRMMYAGIRESLAAFCVYDWPGYTVGPEDSYIRKMIHALERVERGEITRLIITLPPRHYKSETLKRFAAWHLGRHRDQPLMFVSHTMDLAVEASRYIREIVKGEAFQAVFPDVTISPTATAADRWTIMGQRGGMKAAGVGSSITGWGAKGIILDDPIPDRQFAESELEMQRLKEWWSSSMYTRLTPNPSEAWIVLLHTRWTEDDLIGWQLQRMREDPKADRWEVINFPAIDEDGKPLLFSLDVYDQIQANQPARDWAALYQQRPIPDEGLVFRETDFVIEDHAPILEHMVRFYDLALTTKTDGDASAGALVGLAPDGTFWILDVIEERLEWPDFREIIVSKAGAESRAWVGVEEVAHQYAAIQDLARNPIFATVPFIPIRADKDKKTRALAWAARARRGHLKLVRGLWNSRFIAQALAFPHGAHDDMVDAVSGAVALLVHMTGDYRYVEEEKPRPGTRAWLASYGDPEPGDDRTDGEDGSGTEPGAGFIAGRESIPDSWL